MTSAPQISSIISDRYAVSLIDLAASQGITEKVEGDLESLRSMLESSEDLSRAIRSPLVNKAQQEKALFDIAGKAGLQTLTKNFLGVLVRNRRIYALASIIKSARREFAKRRGEMTARVEVATALSSEQTAALKDAVSKAVGANVSLDVNINPAILGGVIVTVGSQMIDDSVRRKLERLRLAMNRQANQNIVSNLEEVG